MKPIKQTDCLIRPETVNIQLMRPLHLISKNLPQTSGKMRRHSHNTSKFNTSNANRAIRAISITPRAATPVLAPRREIVAPPIVSFQPNVHYDSQNNTQNLITIAGVFT
jgi:hypothetical protein